MINDETDEIGMYDYFQTHALISDETIDQIHKHCDFSANATEETYECKKAMDVADHDSIDHINIYNIYAPLCLSEDLTSNPKRMVDLYS